MYLYKQKEDILLMPIFAMGLTMMFSLGSDVPPRGLVRCILGITFFIAIIVGHLILPMWRNSKSGVVSTEVKIGFWSALIHCSLSCFIMFALSEQVARIFFWVLFAPVLFLAVIFVIGQTKKSDNVLKNAKYAFYRLMSNVHIACYMPLFYLLAQYR